MEKQYQMIYLFQLMCDFFLVTQRFIDVMEPIFLETKRIDDVHRYLEVNIFTYFLILN